MSAPTSRATLIKAIHAAKTRAGMDDNTYRDMLAIHASGKHSSKDCTDAQLRQVLAHLNRAVSGSGFRPSSRPEVRLIYALWGDAKRRAILDNPSKAGLRAFCARMANLGKDAATDPEFLEPSQCQVVIEALKSWIKRDGGSR
jgi:hypothetical protein